VAVNLSVKQVASGDFVDTLQALVAAAGIKPSQLELEVTESLFLISPEESAATLRTLEDLGFQIALDDFGTGYSSLTYLRLFPVDKLKIDKSFIDTVPGRETVLVNSLIKLAQELDMTVVAEGVESKEQYEYLAACRCDLIQGYLISRPLSEEDALRFLAERNGRR
jgi:EAL domain-containing protein (putative c-di-GMP-specific phosphodiesterase class I)